MAEEIKYDWGIGFGIIMGIILLVVIVYTIIKLRKQVGRREAAEKKKQTKVGGRKETSGEREKDGNNL